MAWNEPFAAGQHSGANGSPFLTGLLWQPLLAAT